MSNDDELGRHLVERGIVTPEQLAEAVQLQQSSMRGGDLVGILQLLNYIRADRLAEARSLECGIASVDLGELDIDEEIIGLVETNIAYLYRAVPIGLSGDRLYVAMADPTKINNVDNLSRLLHRRIECVYASEREIAAALKRYYPDLE